MTGISVVDELQKADLLRQQGVLSQQEFDAYKAKLLGSSEVTGDSGSVPAPRPSPRNADESTEGGLRSQQEPAAVWAETLALPVLSSAVKTQPPTVTPPPSSPPTGSTEAPLEPPPLAGPPSAQAEAPSLPSVKQRPFPLRTLLIIGIVVIVLAITFVAVVVVHSGTPNTVHVKVTMSASGTPLFPGATPVSFSITQEGAFDFTNKSASLTLRAPNASGTGVEVIQARVIGSTLYLNAPGLRSADGGKSWVQVGLAQYEKMKGQSGSTSMLNVNGNTLNGEMTQLRTLIRRHSKVTNLGPATIDGVATTHYRVMLPVTTTSSGSISISGGSGASWPADVWVDAKGRLSQLRIELPFLGVVLSETLTLSDYGSPVSVTPPPANQTANGTPLLNSGQLAKILGGRSTNSGAQTLSWSAANDIAGTNPVQAVSCTSTTFCVAGDKVGNVYTYNGTSWSAANDIAGTYPVEALSCTSPSFCVAGDVFGNVYTYNGTSWSAANDIEEGDSGSSVSCTSASFCMAGDIFGNVHTYNGTSWSAANDIAGITVNALSCTSASFCMAGDVVGNVYTYNGRSWSAANDIAGTFPVEGLSCTSASFCVAGDFSGNVYTYNGTSWSAANDIAPAGVSALSCTSASFCVAGDFSGNVYTYNGTSWSAANDIAGTNKVDALSCTSASFCVVGDNAGNVYKS